MDNKNVDRMLAAASMRFADELQKYPIEVAVGVGIVIPNLVNGCSWGFVNDSNEEFKKCLNAIQSNPNMSAYRVKGGYLFNMDMSYLVSILTKVAGGFVTKRDLELAVQHRKQSLAYLEKFLKKGVGGKIGIYNLNDSPRITVQGVSYPAFCVTMPDLLAACVRSGYGLKLGGKVRTPGQVNSHILQVVEKLEIAPSGNALFIEVCKYQ